MEEGELRFCVYAWSIPCGGLLLCSPCFYHKAMSILKAIVHPWQSDFRDGGSVLLTSRHAHNYLGNERFQGFGTPIHIVATIPEPKKASGTWSGQGRG